MVYMVPINPWVLSSEPIELREVIFVIRRKADIVHYTYDLGRFDRYRRERRDRENVHEDLPCWSQCAEEFALRRGLVSGGSVACCPAQSRTYSLISFQSGAENLCTSAE